MRFLKNAVFSGLIAVAVGIASFIGAGQFVLYYNGGPGPVALDNNAGAGFAVALFALVVALPISVFVFFVSLLYLQLRKRYPVP
jgi:hypothetical protein